MNANEKRVLASMSGGGADINYETLKPLDLRERGTACGTVGNQPFDEMLIANLVNRGVKDIHVAVFKSDRCIVAMAIPKFPVPLCHILEHSVDKNGGSLRYEDGNGDIPGYGLFESE